MGRALKGESTEENLKTQLVSDICDISTRALQCNRLHRDHSGRRSPFLDWYLVLQVEESAGLDAIRKQYLKLALKLHPDKNKHPKSDFAFKLVSEAYACLSDNTWRAEFNVDRVNNICIDCNKTRYTRKDDPDTGATKTKRLFHTERLRREKLERKLNNLGERMSEEIRVIENCLKTNNAIPVTGQHIHRPLSCKEYPVFSPSDYLSRGYPHPRTTGIFHHTKMGSYQKKEEYPIFGLRSPDTSKKSRYSCLR